MRTNDPSTAPGNGGASGTSACTGGVDSTSTPSAPPSLVPVTAIDLCTAAMSMDYRDVPLHEIAAHWLAAKNGGVVPASLRD